MEINEFKARLKSGTVSGAYLFAGEEDYLKKFYLTQLRESVVTDSSLAPFNHIVYDGEKIDFASLSDAVKAPPMMSDYKLVEWRYPNLAALKEDELEELERLLAVREEYEYSVLAFITSEDGVDLGTLKRESKFTKRFGAKMAIIRLDRSNESQLASWIRRHLDADGVKYTRDMPEALVFRSGRSMQSLKNEIDKLSAFAKAREKVLDSSDVELLATPTTECDTFAFSNALLAKDKQMALAALADMKARRVDPMMILGMAAKVVCDLVNVAELAEDGMNAEDIAKALSMNAYKLKLYLASAKKLGTQRCEELLFELLRVDTASKFGGIGGYTAIELFTMQNM